MDPKSPVPFKTPTSDPSTRPASQEGVPEWETKLGKMIFYITIAAGLWFFYWFNGIQCPCGQGCTVDSRDTPHAQRLRTDRLRPGSPTSRRVF